MDDYAKDIIKAASQQEAADLGYKTPKPVETNPYASERRTLTGADALSFLEANGYAVAPNGNAIASPRSIKVLSDSAGHVGISDGVYPTPTSQLLETRASTHGDYGKTAETAQALKRAMYDARRLPRADMRESIDLICTKMARIANGDPTEPDHWRDIAGYAQLVADRLGA